MKYVCPYTKKQFKSQGAWDNYKSSKKYKQLVAKHGEKEEFMEITPAKEEKVELLDAALLEDEDEEESEEDSPPPRKSKFAGFDALDMGDDDEEEEGDEEKDDDEAMQKALEAMLIRPDAKPSAEDEGEEGTQQELKEQKEEVWVQLEINNRKEGEEAEDEGEEDDEEVVVVLDFDEDDEETDEVTTAPASMTHYTTLTHL